MKNLVLLGVILYSLNSFAQIGIGNIRSSKTLWTQKINKEQFSALKSGKTYFVVPNSIPLEITEKEISSIWSFNSIEFITQEDYDNNDEKYLQEGNSIVNFLSYAIVGKATYVFFEFKYFLVKKSKFNKKGKFKGNTETIARVMYTQDVKNKLSLEITVSEDSWKYGKSQEDASRLYNFSLGYTKNYFQFLNDQLKKGTTEFNLEDDFKTNKLKVLKKETLYIPEWVLDKYNPFTFSAKKKGKIDDLVEDYKFKYEVVSNEFINKNILQGNEIYYLSYTQFNHYKILSVVNASDGSILYLNTKAPSFNVKGKDLKALNKAIMK